MNPRLLRPTSSTLDADAAVYLNAVAEADQQQLEPAVRKAINDFVVGCKRDGIWDALKASCILMGAHTLSGALVPLKGGNPSNSNFVSGDYDRKTGLVGDASTKFINPNRNSLSDPQDSRHMSCFVTDAGSAGSISHSVSVILGRTFARPNSSGTTSHSLIVSGFLYGVSRFSASNYDLRVNGSTTLVSAASTSLSSEQNRFFGRNNNTTYTDARLAFYSMGESLDLALLDSRVTALYNAIGAAI
jgi:hypothetical protein